MESTGREITFGIIKPETLGQRKEIKNYINKNGLDILESKETSWIPKINELYNGEWVPTFTELYEELENIYGNTCEALLIGGQDSIEKLNNISGPTNGKDYLGTDTIRGNFGTPYHKKYGDKYVLWANGFHCADSVEDVKRETPIFFQEKVLNKYKLLI